MKELNAFREFLSEGKGSTVKLSKSDMDKLHKDGEIEVDDHIIQFGEGEENVSENTTMPDIEIMGQKFNFSDICPSAHKLVQNQAIVHHGHSNTAPTVLKFAVLHRDFFNLERKALGSQGITVDEFNDEVKPLYDKILDVAADLMVRKSAKEYMDMHMAKIKDAGFKASEPGGSSDRNFEERYEPTDKELDYADEIEYEQDWRDEQDDLFGKIREVRSRLENEVEGYTDLHKNDVVLEAFLGESNAERNPLRGIKNMFQAVIPLKLDTNTLSSLGYAKATGIKGDWNAIQFFTEYPDKYEKYKDLLSQANSFGVDINPSTNVLDAYNAISAAANEYDLRENLKKNLKEGPIQTFTQGLDKYTQYPHVYVFKVRTMSTDKQGGKFVHNSRYEIEEDMTFNEAVKQAEYFIGLPETIGVKVDLYYTTGNTEGQLGGQAEVLRWTHDAWYKDAKSDYIKNAQANQFEDEEAERIIAIRKWLNSSSIGRQPQNVDNQEESWSTAISSMKQKVADILATK